MQAFVKYNRTKILVSKQLVEMFTQNQCQTTGTPSYYVDEDYPAGSEIQQPLPEWSNWRGSESVTRDGCLRLALHTSMVHAGKELP